MRQMETKAQVARLVLTAGYRSILEQLPGNH